MPNYFFLVDCNNFYVSCERLFQPKLNGKAVVVLSNNDGCVIARSNEAKALGIGMGVPLFKIPAAIRRQLVTFSSNYTLYGDLSARLHALLGAATDAIECYSIDESFLQLKLSPQEAERFARALRDQIAQYIGLPVSIGIAPTKTLSKLANHLAKKQPQRQGVCLLQRVHEEAGKVPVGDVWGIGRKTTEKLKALDVQRVHDFMRLPMSWLKNHFGVTLARTHLELQGQICFPLTEDAEPRQSALSSRSFHEPITDIESLLTAISEFASRATQKCRKEGLTAGVITVFFETSRFHPPHRQFSASTLINPSNDDAYIVKNVVRLVQSLYVDGLLYKRAGVLLQDLQSQSAQVDSLTAESPLEGVTDIMDTINARFGGRTLYLARQGHKLKPLKAENRSPAYTTRWSDILTIQI